MKQELAQNIALMRYSMISPLIVGLPDEYKSKEAYFRAASARGALHPNGTFIHPAPTSIKRWYQRYQKNGFDGLLPQSRSDEGTSRKIDSDLEEQIRYLKTNYPVCLLLLSSVSCAKVAPLTVMNYQSPR